VVSLFAVTHQGPAQGGKAGDSKLSGDKFTKNRQGLQVNFSNNHKFVWPFGQLRDYAMAQRR
jgi:hypothetical protein